MKNRMDVPKEYEPVLPGKVEAHLAKKKETQETDQDSLLTQTAIGIGKVIMQLELLSPNSPNKFDVRHLTPGQFQELNLLVSITSAHLIPGIEKESIDD